MGSCISWVDFLAVAFRFSYKRFCFYNKKSHPKKLPDVCEGSVTASRVANETEFMVLEISAKRYCCRSFWLRPELEQLFPTHTSIRIT